MENLNLNISELMELADEHEHVHLNSSADYDDPECYRSNSLELVSSALQLFLVILYSCTSFLSLLGNVIVIAVQLVGSESAKSVRHHLISLAIADVISGVLCVPFSYTNYVRRQWIFFGWLCPVVQYAQLLSVFITSSTLTTIGIERYMATVYPFSCTHRWLQSHTKLLLILTWILGSAYAFIPILHTRATEFEQDGATYLTCTYDNEISDFKRRLFMNFNFILTFLIPSLTLTCSYAAILKKMKRQKEKNVYFNDCQYPNKRFSPNNNHSLIVRKRSKRISNRLKTIKLMFTIIILYDICWFPIKLYQFLIDLDLITFCSELQFKTLIFTYIFFHWLAMSNSMVNPILYSFLCKSFRNDFKKMIKMLGRNKNLEVELKYITTENAKGSVFL